MATELIQLVSIIFLMHVDFLHAQKFMRGCVFESSSRLRTRDATFTVRDIDFTLCTHYIYASARVDINGLTVEPADRKDEEGLTGLYKQFNDGKKKLKGTKTILSVRGAVASTDTTNGLEYIIQRDPSFKRFPQNAVKYVRDHGFDGINIDWPIGIANNNTQVLSTLLRVRDISKLK